MSNLNYFLCLILGIASGVAVAKWQTTNLTINNQLATNNNALNDTQFINDSSALKNTPTITDTKQLKNSQTITTQSVTNNQSLTNLKKNISTDSEGSKKLNSDNETKDVYIELFRLDENTDYNERLSTLDTEELQKIKMDKALASQILLTYWAKKNPSAAWDWTLNNEHRIANTRSQFKVILEYLKIDPIGAEQALENLSDSASNLKNDALEVAASNFYYDNPLDVEKFSDQFSSEEFKGRAVLFMTKHLDSNKGSESSLKYLQQQSYLLPEEAIQSIGISIGQNMITSAIDNRSIDEKYDSLINSSNDKKIRRAAISGFLENLATYDSNQVIDKINILSDPDDKNSAILSVLRNDSIDTLSSISIAKNLTDDETRENAMLKIISNWISKNDETDISQLLNHEELGTNIKQLVQDL